MIETHLKRAVASTNWSGKSDLVAVYESQLAAMFGSKHAVAVNSGSAAIQIALTVAGAGPGKKVAVSMAAPLPSLLPLLATGAEPLLVDCCASHPGIDVDSLRDKLDEHTVAVLEVPLWGYPQPLDGLKKLLARHASISLVEDAAQAHGSSTPEGFVGTRSDFGCFSTHHKKLLSTGEGGFILTDDDANANKVRLLGRLGGLDGIQFGWNCKISAFTAAVGLSGLETLEQRAHERRANAVFLADALYASGFRELPHIGSPNGYNLVGHFEEPSVNQRMKQAMIAAGISQDDDKYGYKPANKHRLLENYSGDSQSAASIIQRLIQIPTETPIVTLASIEALLNC